MESSGGSEGPLDHTYVALRHLDHTLNVTEFSKNDKVRKFLAD